MKTVRCSIIAISLLMVSMAAAQRLAPKNDALWAVDVVKRFKITGLRVGSNTVKLSRPLSRAEVAMIGYLVFCKTKAQVDILGVKANVIDKRIDKSKVEKDFPAERLRADINEMKALVASMKSCSSDNRLILKMTKSYEKEFRSMGIDLAQMRNDLLDITSRITCQEPMDPPKSKRQKTR